MDEGMGGVVQVEEAEPTGIKGEAEWPGDSKALQPVNAPAPHGPHPTHLG